MLSTLQRRALTTAALALMAGSVSAQSITTQHVATLPGTGVYLSATQNDDRLFLTELEGRVRIVENGSLLPTPFLDVSGLVSAGAFTGLRSLSFHPDYASNGFFYVSYDQQAGGTDLVVERYSVSASSPNLADPASGVEILRIAQDFAFHGGGEVHFDAAGLFYVAVGDGYGIGGDGNCNAQNGQRLLGKMLRLDVDGGVPYVVPPDNPFVGDPNVRDEIWHLGLRHPWRWSFDRATGDAYIGDVGQSTREEVDFQAAGVSGLNFGWKVMEGTTCHSSSACAPTTPACDAPEYSDPIHEYPLVGNCSITGGYVYRGAAIPSLVGSYVYGDYCSGRVWSFRYDGANLTDMQERTNELGGPFANLTSFGEDAAGELYIVQQSGIVRRIEPGCGTTSYCATSPNSAGAGAVLSSGGSTSLAQNDFILHVADAAHGQPGLFYYGALQVSLPFGDGLRCVGGSTHRLNPPTVTDGLDGSASRPVDFNAPPANAGPGEIAAGSTWNFQCWYRDPNGAGGSGFNLSDGLSATFCP